MTGSNFRRCCLTLIAVTTVSGCARAARHPVSDGMGPHPVLPEPQHALIPIVRVAPAKGWPGEATPTPSGGLRVTRFAMALAHPRWLYVLPNGDVLVAETNAPTYATGIKGWIMKRYFKAAGGAVPSANRITLLRDRDGDGVAESRFAFLEGLHSPFGMALVGSELYVANTDAIVHFTYTPGQTRIAAPGTKLVDLPAELPNYHWTKNIIASADGSRLYVTVGSNSNVAEGGIKNEDGRAAIWEIDPRTGSHRIFATGLRNPVGLAWEPASGALWVSVNERDELGSDLVPDYMTSVRDGAFYGWPYTYFGQHLDDRAKPARPDLVGKAVVPDYALGAHTASLGLTSSKGTTLPAPFKEGMFVGQHGSWNRAPKSGYRVIFVPFAGGKPSGDAIEVLTGFLDKHGAARGRPVGVAIDTHGSLLVADDVGNVVWRVSAP